MSRALLVSLSLMLMAIGTSWAQPKPIYLWADVPNMQRERTRLYVYDDLPEGKRTGMAVIICPGGSYHHLGMRHEGHNVARWLNQHGIAAYVLRYRVGAHGYRHPAMLEDVQLAMRYVRLHHAPKTLGLIGFSAGGHLVLMAAEFSTSNTLTSHGVAAQPDELRPDFVVPVYPVVSMRAPIAHARSRKNLIGRRPSPALIDSLSLERHVPSNMPPTLLIATADDPVVNPQNSLMLDSALSAQQVNHRFVFYDRGRHGFGYKPDNPQAPAWQEQLHQWLNEMGLLTD
ncbi:MAG: alpha/beta hydrolase [Bacteroidales bacterium]|nr:alpha/beta hydrolase [Bacteroidales bacterium]